MSQLPEILASAYTQEMETLGALPDIPTFDGEPVSVSRNPLTPGTRPLQFLPLSGTEFPVRYETSRMRGFRSEELENGRLRRHQSHQSSAVSWLQAEVEQLRTRLEVEGIPLDSSERRRMALLRMAPPHLPPLRLLLVLAVGGGSLAAHRSMAYFPDRISRQYGMTQRVPRAHNFESGLITPHLLTNLADR
ncbi:hypothetical protein JCGZ_18393 [Jatropha curcas]|uniref:Uncharacterized protein n=1 Tax=Jatropha curcas TaxID=180498 RepID=A0A067K4T1_JATCU|nr:hypothetical protein JCGZ_18393 [Jatropha curcas]